MKYLVLDFETSCKDRASICSIGYALLDDSNFTDKGSYLCRPDPFEFDETNIAINGIVRSLVYDKPLANVFLPQILNLDYDYIVSHNAEFDMNCLYQIAEKQDIHIPHKPVLCTMILASRILATGYIGLGHLCDFLGIKFNHHEAGDDAFAAAIILQHILSLENYDLKSLTMKYAVTPGEVSNNGYVPLEYKKAVARDFELFSPSPNQINKTYATPINNSLANYAFVFTGDLDTMPRAEAMIEIFRRSGKVNGSTTLKTTHIIAGEAEYKNYQLEKQCTSKIEKAIKYNHEKNLDIKIISEKAFLELLEIDKSLF
ncbi:MAG: hypothetical protein MSC43_05930 [Clostridiales bacterium]|nr:hypothetical protein [Clostridiales bacterium]